MSENIDKVNELISSAVDTKVAPVVEENVALKSSINELKKEIAEMKTITIEKEEADKPQWKSMGEYITAVHAAGMVNGGVDKRLKSAAGDGQKVGVDADGGYTVPVEYRSVETVVDNKAHLASRCTIVPMNSQTMKCDYELGLDESGLTVRGGLKWYDTAELAELTSSHPTYGQYTLALKKMTGLSFISGEMLKYNPSAVATRLSAAMRGDALAQRMDQILIDGAGSSTEGEGFMNSDCRLNISRGTVSTVKYADVVAMDARFEGNRANACFVASPTIKPQLSTMVLSNQPMFVAAGTAAGSVNYDMLWGKPVIFCDSMQTLGTSGDLALVDFSKVDFAQAAGEGVEEAVSIDLKFEYHQNAYRWITYYDSINRWPSVFTPHRGDTRSCVVVLI